MKIAIPHLGESVAPCFEYSATMAIFTVEENLIVDKVDVPLRSRIPYDRVRLMNAKQVDTVICGGVQALYEDLLKDHGIRVISWVSGSVEDLLNRFMEGRLSPGTARLGVVSETPAAKARESEDGGDDEFPESQVERTNL